MPPLGNNQGIHLKFLLIGSLRSLNNMIMVVLLNIDLTSYSVLLCIHLIFLVT